ncbi:MAG: hypothetical protein ACP5HM_02130 [Anaerolineae bacterium]
MKKTRNNLLLSLMLSVLLGSALMGCTPPSGFEESPLSQPPPLLESPVNSPEPTSTEELVSNLAAWDIDPAPGRAVIRGHIEKTRNNIVLGEIFLAKAVPTSNPDIDLLELDEQTAPKAEIDRDTLTFVFTNVEPGRYGLIVWEPMNSVLLNDPETGETLFIDIESGEVIDLGTVYFP